MQTPLIVEQTYNAPIRRIWKALTDKDQMKAWYFQLADFKAEKGFKFQFSGGDENTTYLHECEILEVDPPHKLSYSWRYPDYPGYSVLTFELKEEGPDSTHVKLSHSGLESFPQDDPNFRIESFTQGWNSILGESLKHYVEMETIRKEVAILSTADTIWDIFLHPAGQWGKAFGGNVTVKTTWAPGTEIVWDDEEGNVGARGIITTHRPHQFLEAAMYDDVNPVPDEQPGEYMEKYSLEKQDDKSYVFRIEAGPISRMYLADHAGMWDEALQIIKDLAEERA